MSHKQAKSLRKSLGYHPAQEHKYYDKVVKTVMVNTGRVDEKGNAIIIPEVHVQRLNVGIRAAYRGLK